MVFALSDTAQMNQPILTEPLGPDSVGVQHCRKLPGGKINCDGAGLLFWGLRRHGRAGLVGLYSQVKGFASSFFIARASPAPSSKAGQAAESRGERWFKA